MEESGVGVKEWIGFGGASKSALWCQIKADITNRPFMIARRADDGAGDNTLGLAVMIGHSVGLYNDLVGQINSFLPNRTRYEPSAGRHALYQELFQIYTEIADSLRPSFARLAAINIKARASS
jgi:xylulokinase